MMKLYLYVRLPRAHRVDPLVFKLPGLPVCRIVWLDRAKQILATLERGDSASRYPPLTLLQRRNWTTVEDPEGTADSCR